MTDETYAGDLKGTHYRTEGGGGCRGGEGRWFPPDKTNIRKGRPFLCWSYQEETSDRAGERRGKLIFS